MQSSPLIRKFSSLLGTFGAKSPSSSVAVKRIGMNVGKVNIVGCEITMLKDTVTLERCARVPVDSTKTLSQQVKGFCDTIGFESKRVNLSVKGQGIVIRFLTFPRMGREEFGSSIQFEAEKYLPFNLSEVVLDYHMNERPDSKRTDGNMDVILVAARRTEIEKVVKAVKATGLTLNAIDIDIFACVNALEFAVPEMKEQVIGLIDFGAADTTLCMCYRGVITFSRDIAFGGNDMTDMIRRKLDVPLEEASKIQHERQLTDPVHLQAIQESLDRLFQELKLSLNYFFTQHQNVEKIDCFYISGGFSQLTGLPELLEQKLEIPTKRWDPTAKMSLSKAISRAALDPMVPYLPVCTGLALRQK